MIVGCDRADDGNAAAAAVPQPCAAPQRVADLPKSIREASGVAASRTHAGVLWVLSDSDPYLYAIDRNGRELGRLRVPLEGKVRDWEDLAIGTCGDRDCLYIGDFGDNGHERTDIAVFRIPEPAPGDETTARPERFPFAYPDGPRDAEALIVLPGERLFIVSKGRRGPVALYRFPPLADAPLALERVHAFTPGVVQMPEMVTGATASPSGRWVAIRSYAFVDIHAADARGIATERTARISLDALDEPQGEGVAFAGEGELFLVSERALGRSGPLSTLRCTLE